MAMGANNTPHSAQPEESNTSIAACSKKFTDLSAIQEVKAEGPLLTSPTHPNSPDMSSAKHAPCFYTTTRNKEYSNGSGSEGLCIQRTIRASLCSTRDWNRSNAHDVNLSEPDKITSKEGPPPPSHTTTRTPQTAKTP